jgi:hypothetical protein
MRVGRRFPARTALVLSCLSFAIAGTALVSAQTAAPRRSVSAVETGPIARAQWQETLRTAFDDMARMPATLPNRGEVGFNLRTEPEPSMLAQPELPPGRFM